LRAAVPSFVCEREVIEMTLREALEHALAGTLDDEARKHIELLLAQRVEKYGTLIDECEVAIYG
jgi:hypothetical protein